MTGEAFGNVDIGSLFLEGGKVDASIRDAISQASIKRSIEGVPTLTISVIDDHRKLLRSGMLSGRITMQINGYSFELAKIKKNGSQISLVFEEITAAVLRRLDKPRKIAAGAMTRAAFIRSLVAEGGPWIRFVQLGTSEVTKSELARGTVLDETSTDKQRDALERRRAAGNLEDTWAATGRLAEDVQWRRFIRGPKEFVYASEAGLAAQKITGTYKEFDEAVTSIDFDWDTGKEEAKATITAFADRWTIPPGSRIALKDMGPASSDKWLVAEIERSLFSALASITLRQPRPSLPEPLGASSELGDEFSDEIIIPDGYGDLPVGDGLVSAQGFMHPVSPVNITSRYGPRSGRNHDGLDYDTSDNGQPVWAAKGGVVSDIHMQKPGKTGYGYYIDITHNNGNRTRYAHLQQIAVRRGVNVDIGQPIGITGGVRGAEGAGNSTGSHLHFEIHHLGFPANPTLSGWQPIDPERYLPPITTLTPGQRRAQDEG